MNVKVLYFRIIIKSTNYNKCFERLLEQRRCNNWKYNRVISVQLSGCVNLSVKWPDTTLHKQRVLIGETKNTPDKYVND